VADLRHGRWRLASTTASRDCPLKKLGFGVGEASSYFRFRKLVNLAVAGRKQLPTFRR
jgi:hypothetical protein